MKSPSKYRLHLDVHTTQIYSRVKQEGEQRVNAIPFYALVPDSDPEARFPRARSEQKEMSVKGLPYTSSGASGGVRLVNTSPRVSYEGGGSVAGSSSAVLQTPNSRVSSLVY